MTCHPVRGGMVELGLEPGPSPMPYSHALDPAPLFHKVMHLTQGLAPVGGDSLKQLEHGCPGPFALPASACGVS